MAGCSCYLRSFPCEDWDVKSWWEIASQDETNLEFQSSCSERLKTARYTEVRSDDTDLAGASSVLLLFLLSVLSASGMTGTCCASSCCSFLLPGVVSGLALSSPNLFSWRLCFLRLAFLLGCFAGASLSSSETSDSLSDSSDSSESSDPSPSHRQ